MKKHRIHIREVPPHMLATMTASEQERLLFGMKRAVAELALPGYVSPEALWFLQGGGVEKYLPERIIKTVVKARCKRGAK